MINKGFTLIETMIAVLLLSLAIAGPLTIASKGLSSALIAKDQVGAFYLAQDAVEYVRFARDSNKLAGGNWLTGTASLANCEGSSGCYLDSTDNNPAAPVACTGTCPTLNYNKSTYMYTYATADGSTVVQSPERYIRTVKLTTPVGSNSSEAALTVTVQWTGAGGLTHNVTYREDIYDWQ